MIEIIIFWICVIISYLIARMFPIAVIPFWEWEKFDKD